MVEVTGFTGASLVRTRMPWGSLVVPAVKDDLVEVPVWPDVSPWSSIRGEPTVSENAKWTHFRIWFEAFHSSLDALVGLASEYVWSLYEAEFLAHVNLGLCERLWFEGDGFEEAQARWALRCQAEALKLLEGWRPNVGPVSFRSVDDVLAERAAGCS